MSLLGRTLGLIAKIFGYGPAAPVLDELAREADEYLTTLQDGAPPVPFPSAAVRHRDAQIASAAHAFPPSIAAIADSSSPQDRARGITSRHSSNPLPSPLRPPSAVPPPCPASLPPSAPPEPAWPPPGPPVPAPPWHQPSVEEPCRVPPPGWVCSRTAGHSGPCAARPAPGYGTSDVDYPPVTLPLTPSPLPPRPRPLARASSGPPPRMPRPAIPIPPQGAPLPGKPAVPRPTRKR